MGFLYFIFYIFTFIFAFIFTFRYFLRKDAFYLMFLPAFYLFVSLYTYFGLVVFDFARQTPFGFFYMVPDDKVIEAILVYLSAGLAYFIGTAVSIIFVPIKKIYKGLVFRIY